MTKEETTMTGFEIVSYSGDARSKLLTALSKAKEKKFDECDQLIEAAAECLKEAHDSQMDVMQAEATGDDSCTRPPDDNIIIKRYHWNTDRRISCVNKRGSRL